MYDFWFYRLDRSWQELSLYKVTKNFILPLFISIFTFIAGYNLLLNKKGGWAMALVILFYRSISLIAILFTFEIEENFHGEIENEFLLFSLFSLLPLAFITLLIILLSKPFRSYYNPSKKTWYFMFGIFTTLLITRFVLK